MYIICPNFLREKRDKREKKKGKMLPNKV